MTITWLVNLFILFNSCLDISVLEPYKYAGYPMLIKTIELETHDDELFSKAAPLLSAASALSYHTMDCSALNAEELRRENGLQTLHNAFARCSATLSAISKPSELAVQVNVILYSLYLHLY